MLTALAVTAGVAVIVWALRGWRRGDAPGRFTMRVHAAGSHVVLGTSADSGDAPDLAALAVDVIDDGDHVVAIPADTVLRVRAFAGATRTRRNGRYTFEIPRDVRFWILDAPSWLDCTATSDPERRALPRRAGGYDITTRLPPSPQVNADGTIDTMSADLWMPLWMHGMHGPDDWLLGARPDERAQIVVCTFTGDAVGSTVFQLVDALWLQTCARALAGVPIVVGRARVIAGQPNRWETFERVRRLKPGATIVWGEATDGLVAHVRGDGDDHAFEVRGDLRELRSAIVAAFAARGIAPRSEPPCRVPSPIAAAHDARVAMLYDRLFALILAHPSNAGLPVPDRVTQRDTVRAAHALARELPDSDVAQLVWIVAAIYARACGGLDAELRDEVLAFIRTRTDDADPLRRLAPAILDRLGAKTEAAELCQRDLAAIGAGYRGELSPAHAAYRTWLDKVLAAATAP